MTADYLQQVTLGAIEQQPTIQLVAADPMWPAKFAVEQRKIKQALGATALRIEHVGSTSIAGLCAKPIIDILLLVPDAADEAAYVPQLTKAGYILRIRESDWHHHRMFRGITRQLHLHVFSDGCSEAQQMIQFRDWLRHDTADRQWYQATKAELAAKKWPTMQAYADAKGPVVTAIKAHATTYFDHHNN